AFLEAQQSVRAEFTNLAAFDPRGRLVASLIALPVEKRPNASGKQYFEATVSHRRGIVSTPFKSRLSGTPAVLVTDAVFDASGAIVLVLTGGIDLSTPNFL